MHILRLPKNSQQLTKVQTSTSDDVNKFVSLLGLAVDELPEIATSMPSSLLRALKTRNQYHRFAPLHPGLQQNFAFILYAPHRPFVKRSKVTNCDKDIFHRHVTSFRGASCYLLPSSPTTVGTVFTSRPPPLPGANETWKVCYFTCSVPRTHTPFPGVVVKSALLLFLLRFPLEHWDLAFPQPTVSLSCQLLVHA